MKKLALLVVMLMVLLCGFAFAEGFDASVLVEDGSSVEHGPYTIEKLAEGVYHIEDGIESYKPGYWLNEDGSFAYDENGNYMNNCADMYVVLGEEKAALIDLSNRIERDNAMEALPEIVYGLIGDLELEIIITHGHGDHIGMAAAFVDTDAPIWIPEKDYASYFGPYYGLTQERVSLFTPEKKSFDLGGRSLSTVRVTGHTVDSTVFVIDGESIIFSGDAFGSGSGVWIWGSTGLANFAVGMENFMQYALATFSVEEMNALKIYSGHAWQYGKFVEGGADYLDWQYIVDMYNCINLVTEGAWLDEESGLVCSKWANPINTLDCDFIYGTAAISTGYQGACDYAGVTAQGIKKSDYRAWGEYLEYDDVVSFGTTYDVGNALDLFDEYVYSGEETAEVGDLTYYVYDPIAHGADPDGVYPVLYWFHGAGNGLEGKLAVIYGGAAMFATEEYQELMGGAYVICPIANEYYDENGRQGTWMTRDASGNTSAYSAALKAALDVELAKIGDNAGDTIIVGTSAGGYCAWRYILDHTDSVDASLLMAAAYLPSEADLAKVEEAGIRIWITNAYHDELIRYDNYIKPIVDKLIIMENVELTVLEWVRNGDKGIASLFVGMEMGQHCICSQIGGNLIYDDGTPYDITHPDGVTGWVRDIAEK